MKLDKEFTSKVYRFVFTMLSMVIIIPMIDSEAQLSFFIASCVYAFGRLPDYIDAIQYGDGNEKLQMAGLFVGVVLPMMCFYSFSKLSLAQGNVSGNFVYATLFVIMALAFIDLLILIYYMNKRRYTKDIIAENLKNGEA